ncbi:MAG TPA: phage tail tape measure protein [Xanthobacteraceae bacterium]|nr:phage tail tape measure protein [Xanthobacteraceae bacterium]
MIAGLELRTRDLERTANGFARAMTQAFSSSVVGGRQFDDVLKSLVLRMSDLAVRSAFQPIAQGLTSGITSGLNTMMSGLFGGLSFQASHGAVKPFAAGGVIGTPTYFPLNGGGIGLAGEAGPEAILPLKRGGDGRLGVVMNGAGGATQVTVNIATPDADSFRRSESYLTGQIARAVSRGRRSQ